MPTVREPMMYVLELLSHRPPGTGVHAKVSVVHLELELTDDPMVFTDFMQLYLAMQDHQVDHVYVCGSEDCKAFVELVDRTLYDLSFDVCDYAGLPKGQEE